MDRTIDPGVSGSFDPKLFLILSTSIQVASSLENGFHVAVIWERKTHRRFKGERERVLYFQVYVFAFH